MKHLRAKLKQHGLPSRIVAGKAIVVEASDHLKEYTQALKARNDAIRQNASKRMRGLKPGHVPPKPDKLFGYQVFLDSTYFGFHPNDDKIEAIEEAKSFMSKEEGMTGKITVKRKPLLGY